MLIPLINIAVLLLYWSFLKSLMKGDYDFLVLLVCLAIHFVICVFIGLFYKYRGFLTSGLIIFIVGLFAISEVFFSR